VRTIVLGESQQLSQTFGRGHGVARRAMATFDLDAEVVADGIEIAPR
jgi:hypothetical protein